MSNNAKKHKRGIIVKNCPKCRGMKAYVYDGNVFKCTKCYTFYEGKK